MQAVDRFNADNKQLLARGFYPPANPFCWALVCKAGVLDSQFFKFKPLHFNAENFDLIPLFKVLHDE